MKSDGRSVRFNSIIFQSFEDCCLIVLLNASKDLLTWPRSFSAMGSCRFFHRLSFNNVFFLNTTHNDLMSGKFRSCLQTKCLAS